MGGEQVVWLLVTFQCLAAVAFTDQVDTINDQSSAHAQDEENSLLNQNRRLSPLSWFKKDFKGGKNYAETIPQTPNTRSCFPVPPQGTPKPRRRGQVVQGTSFAAALRSLAREADVLRVLEIGTFYGGGSTVSLGTGIQESFHSKAERFFGGGSENCVRTNSTHKCCHSFVTTMEVFQPAYEHARKYLMDLPIKCVLGSTVGADELLQKNELSAEMKRKSEHFRLYYDRDYTIMKNSVPQLRPLCSQYKFELVLIDGNEYSGWAEFIHVKNECKPKWLALHDTETKAGKTYKMEKVEAYLDANHDEYELFLKKGSTHKMAPACSIVDCKPESSFTRNPAGWKIYKRVI